MTNIYYINHLGEVEVLNQVHEQQQMELQNLLLELQRKKGTTAKKKKRATLHTEGPGILKLSFDLISD